jgi:hypothetical protein
MKDEKYSQEFINESEDVDEFENPDWWLISENQE